MLAQILGEGFDLARTRALGEGTRRALRLWVEDLRWETLTDEARRAFGEAAACIRVYFVLPKGAYATTVLGAPPSTSKKSRRGRRAGRRTKEETDGGHSDVNSLIERVKSAMVGLGTGWILVAHAAPEHRLAGHHARARVALLVAARRHRRR